MKRILTLTLALLALCSFGAEARKVSGTVACGGSGIKDVIVTDGTHFTTTGRKGTYKLEISDDARFVFVVTPKGFTADYSSGTTRYYQSVSAQKSVYDFTLKAAANTNDYKLFAVSDPQLKTEEHFEQFRAEPLAVLAKDVDKAVAEGYNVAVVSLGDEGWDNLPLMEKYQNEMKRIKAPVYNIMGNHDFDRYKQGLENQLGFEERFGPANYAFFLGSDLVICLKDIIYDTDKKYDEGYTKEEIRFVKRLLKKVSKKTHVYICQHSPVYILSDYFKGENPWIQNSRKMLRAVKGHKVDFISGHTHVFNNFQYRKKVYEHNIASICGAFWNSIYCQDGTPRGYLVLSGNKGYNEWKYRTIDFAENHQMEVFGLGECPEYPESIVANIWDYDEEWAVVWYQDGKKMGGMTQVKATSPKATALGNALINNHFFAVTPSEDAQVVTIVASNRFGDEWRVEVDAIRTKE